MADIDFTYNPLGSGSQEIRLLSVLTSRSTQIECDLEHVALNRAPTYNALSYTWGDPCETFPIKLSDRSFLVTKNLLGALQHLRKENETTKFWIDAVSINQRDTAERSVQVQRMKKIYENAASVIIWLGPESDDSTYAMEVMNKIDRRWASRTSQLASDRRIAAPFIDERAYLAICKLFSRAWWRRVWIVQESTCANHTYLRCGEEKAEFLSAIAMVSFMAQNIINQALQADFSSPDIIDLHRVIALDQLRLARSRSGQSLHILSLLNSFRTWEASDPRDKLFALSGLAAGSQQAAAKPNYLVSVDEAYMGFVKTIIDSDRTLDILGHCQEAVRSLQSWSSCEFLSSIFVPKQTLPSWTPDWTLNLEATPFEKNEMPDSNRSNELHRASAGYPPSVKLADDPRTLIIRGFIFDTVSDLGEAFALPFNSSTIKLWYSWTENEVGVTYHGKETTSQAFRRTLVADICVAKGRYKRGFAAPWPIENINDTESSFASSSLIKATLNSRGIFLSEQGYIGVARFDIKKGDKVCVFHGGHVPYILRQEQRHYLFKGECYLHGLMDGEGMRYPRVWQDFALR